MASLALSLRWDQKWDHGVDQVFRALSYKGEVVLPESILVSTQKTTAAKVAVIAFHIFIVAVASIPLLAHKIAAIAFTLLTTGGFSEHLNGKDGPSRPWIIPEEKIDPETSLFLDGKELTEPPNLRTYKNLRTLRIYDNQLTVSPEVSENRHLREFRIENNQITTPPNLANNLNLEVLSLSYNPFDRAPDISMLFKIKVLECSNIGLREPLDVSHLADLQSLDLSGNRLRTAPDLRQNKRLTHVNLSGNQFVRMPDLRDCFSIQWVDLSANDLIEFPHVSPNHRVGFDLSENCLYLDEHFYPWREANRQVSVNLDGNPIALKKNVLRITESKSYPKELEKRLRKQDNPLYFEIRCWTHEFKFYRIKWYPNKIDEVDNQGVYERFEALMSLPQDEKQLLADFLAKLREIQDYIDLVVRHHATQTVYKMLAVAADKPAFREKMLLMIQDGIQTCGDRTNVVLNDIEIERQFHEKELSDEEFRVLAIGAQRYDVVKKHAISLNTKDQVETILRLHRKVHKLPISMRTMRFPDVSDVTPKMIEQVEEMLRQIPEETLLERSHYWQERMEKLHPEEAAEVSEQFYRLLDEVQEYFDAEEGARGQYLESHQGLKAFLENHPVENYIKAAAEIQSARGAAIARLGFKN